MSTDEEILQELRKSNREATKMALLIALLIAAILGFASVLIWTQKSTEKMVEIITAARQ